jgi:glycosyltransferase involved in cell wall biosynthesis
VKLCAMMMKWVLSILFVLPLFVLSTEEATSEEACPAAKKRTNICLNMIVKNEAKVMPRLIESVKDVIDYYVIVDTGSTDETVSLILEEMKQHDIEGVVESREWVNFSTNRNHALELAMEHCNTEWVLFIDADDELVVLDPDFYEKLESGVSYEMSKHLYGTRYPLPNLINIGVSKSWKWSGVVHESVGLDDPEIRKSHRSVQTEDVYIKVNLGEGARSHNVTIEEKFLRDAKLLEDDLLVDPDNCRSMYYLGQSYSAAGHKEKALQAFRKRVAMGGWDQEKFYAQYKVGIMVKELEGAPDAVMEEYLKAWEFRPSRIEPLYGLAEYFRKRNNYTKAFLFAMAGVNMTVPSDTLFNEHDVYQWKMKEELCIVAYYVGRMEEGKWACSELIRLVENGEVDLSPEMVDRIHSNLNFYV